MARAKISEYRAKNILNKLFGVNYAGLSIECASLDENDVMSFVNSHKGSFVVKVDQAVKKRNKLGLVALDVAPENVLEAIKRLAGEGYQWLLLEPFVSHASDEERFIALERKADGIEVSYSKFGGVDIEDNASSLQKYIFKDAGSPLVKKSVFEDVVLLRKLLRCFDDNHLTYLEINPFIFDNGQYRFLDAAVEIDTSALFFVKDSWTLDDVRSPKRDVSEEEQAVEVLASNSPSSLNLKVLNKDGSIFLLLSGGGASVVVVDEFSNLGYHEEIANYGEYSGNPTEEETYLYTKQILKLLLASKARSKVLLVAGGVANFTDVSKTFNGIIHALRDDAERLKQQDVHIFVRRGGPNQEKGLRMIKEFLDEMKIQNAVHGPEVSLSGIVELTVKGL